MKSSSAVVGVTLLLLLAGLALSSWGTVSAGHRGIVLRMGAVTGEIKGEGFYTKTPWIEQVRELDVRTQKEQVESEGASKDLQTVSANVALNFSLDPQKCAHVYQTIGADYMPKVVAPAMQESIKSVVAQFTAEEMISRRELVREEMIRLISSKLTPLGIRIEALSIVNFTFSRSFNEAIEAKVTAEQNALAAKNLLAQKQYEAQQAIAIAKGKAEAMEIESAALAKNPQVLQLRALERWNGVLPMVTGNGAIPFLDVMDLPNRSPR
ncbi:MAG: prohibitin family protein [Kiritimatiellae bacterium]|nr:prohibitin family protein [Kiritimatiellia bacterium]MCO5067961.1 prohibitin family protein [Kiritimatiellia bacterium]